MVIFLDQVSNNKLDKLDRRTVPFCRTRNTNDDGSASYCSCSYAHIVCKETASCGGDSMLLAQPETKNRGRNLSNCSNKGLMITRYALSFNISRMSPLNEMNQAPSILSRMKCYVGLKWRKETLLPRPSKNIYCLLYYINKYLLL